MAKEIKNMWLKFALGLIITMMLLGAKAIERKLDKEVFELHQTHQKTQFDDIKGFLIRIEKKL